MGIGRDEYEALLQGLKSDSADLRRESAEDLGYAGVEEASKELLKYLDDPDKGVRETVSESLKILATEEDAYGIAKYLGNPEIDVRNYAVEILIEINKKAIPALVYSLDDEDHDIRKFAVDILGSIKAEEAVGNVIKKLNDQDENVALSSIECLGNIGSPKAILDIIEASQRSNVFTATSIEALGKIGSKESLPFIREKLSSEDSLVLYSAIETIGTIGEIGDASSLICKLEKEENYHHEVIMRAIIQILDRHNRSIFSEDIDISSYKKYIFDILEDEDMKGFFSQHVRKYLNTINPDKFVGFIRYFKKDLSLDILDIVEEKSESFNIMKDFLDSSEPLLLFRVSEVIINNNNIELIPILRKYLKEGDDIHQIISIRSLSGLQDKESLVEIKRILKTSKNNDIIKESERAVNILEGT